MIKINFKYVLYGNKIDFRDLFSALQIYQNLDIMLFFPEKWKCTRSLKNPRFLLRKFNDKRNTIGKFNFFKNTVSYFKVANQISREKGRTNCRSTVPYKIPFELIAQTYEADSCNLNKFNLVFISPSVHFN